jgi:hypothetical protein
MRSSRRRRSFARRVLPLGDEGQREANEVKMATIEPFHRPAVSKRPSGGGDCFGYAWREVSFYLEACSPAPPRMFLVHGPSGRRARMGQPT